MKVLRYVFIFCIAVISGAVNAQDQDELLELMRSRGEYYFTVGVKTRAEAGTINRICSVDAVDGTTVTCYANQMEYDELVKAGYQPFLQVPPSMRETHVMWDGKSKTWDSYPTYGQYESMMQGFEADVVSGRSCTYIELGTLDSGRKLMGVRINNGSPEGKPKFLYSSTIHGDETTGMILMLRLIDELCTSTDERIVNLVNNLDIFIFPNTNPDGTYHRNNNTVSGATRYNANGVDMNRNYPDFVNGAHPDGKPYQAETQWMMQLAEDYSFTMSANYHGGAEVMNYPWDSKRERHADNAWWQYVCTEYVSYARQVYSRYMTDTSSSGITNGADWYIISGGRQDYMNYYAQCRELTIECSSTKTPSASNLPKFWNYNHNSMLAFMEQCLNGVHGFVYDATSGDPIQGVTVTVVNHDKDGSQVSTHEVGDFHRPIKGGTYTFRFEKSGYESQDVNVTVADGERVDLADIQLVRSDHNEVDFTVSSTDIALGQSVSFTDNSNGIITSWEWTFEGATPSTSTAQHPKDVVYYTPGDYDVTLTVTFIDGSSLTLTKENYIHVSTSVNMFNGTLEICNGIFYDSGGLNSNYKDNEDYTLTLYPCTEGVKLMVDFQKFLIESGCDFLYIYDGTSTSATLIGEYTGKNSPGRVKATNAAGALTFRFTSDTGLNRRGWVATVLCATVLADDVFNGAVIASAHDGEAHNFMLSGRTLYKDGCWNTLCLPFDVNIGGSILDGAIAKTLIEPTGLEGTHVTLTFGAPVDVLEAGKPYIIRWDKADDYDTADADTRDIKNPVFDNVIVTAPEGSILPFDGVSFVGYYDAFTVGVENDNIYYMTANSTLKHTGVNRQLRAFRAYFNIGDDQSGSVREFAMDFGEGEVTSIETESLTPQHVSRQGWFTLDGRRLTDMPTAKGIYLYDGRAVVVR